MRKFALLLAAATLLSPGAVSAQSAGEIIGSTVIQVPADVFQCGRGTSPCNLRARIYNELDPTDFFGAANPVDGYPRYGALGRYIGDSQITGNYPSWSGLYGLNWYAVWDGVLNPNRFDHVGFYGAQSQVVNFSELGNNATINCLPVVAQTACFLALGSGTGNDLDGFGPAGAVNRFGGLSPIPRPTVVGSSLSSIDFAWEQATAATVNDGAPHPIQGYKLFFTMRDANDRFGPSATELATQEALGQLLDATPGTFIPRTTTSYTLDLTHPALAAFNPATQRLVAVIKMVYTGDVLSTQFSANSYAAAFAAPEAQVRDFRARLNRGRVVLSWSADSLAGIRSFNVVRSGQPDGPYHPIDRNDIVVGGINGTYLAVDRLDRRAPMRASSMDVYYRLEVTAMDGTRRYLDPVIVNIESLRRATDGR